MSRERKRDDATAFRMDRVAEIEAKLDPSLRRRGRIIADFVTLAVGAPIAIALDFHVTRPLVLLGLMCGALALNHLVPLITEQRLRRERNRLLAEAETARAETDSDRS